MLWGCKCGVSYVETKRFLTNPLWLAITLPTHFPAKNQKPFSTGLDPKQFRFHIQQKKKSQKNWYSYGAKKWYNDIMIFKGSLISEFVIIIVCGIFNLKPTISQDFLSTYEYYTLLIFVVRAKNYKSNSSDFMLFSASCYLLTF